MRPAVGGPARSDRCREDREQLPNTTMAALIASMRPADGSDELEHLLDEQAAYCRALAAEYEDHALPWRVGMSCRPHVMRFGRLAVCSNLLRARLVDRPTARLRH